MKNFPSSGHYGSHKSCRMDEIQASRGTAEQDMKEVFKMVDMDKIGAISQLVRTLIHCLCNKFNITGTKNEPF